MSPTGPTSSLDVLLPVVDFAHIGERAMAMHGSQFFWVGGYAVGVGFAIRLGLQILRALRGEPADWYMPFIHAAGWILAGLFYVRFCSEVISFVTALGLDSGNENNFARVFAGRYGAFVEYLDSKESVLPSFLTQDGLIVGLMQLIVHIAYVTVLALVFFIKAAQIFLLQTIVTFGPILLGAASIGPFFHTLAVSWFWSLIQVSAWSITMSVLLNALDSFSLGIPQHFNWATEAIISLAFVLMLASVTKVTSMLVCGESAGNLTTSMVRTASSMASMAGVAGGAVAATAGGLGGSFAGGKAMGALTRAMPQVGSALGSFLRSWGGASGATGGDPIGTQPRRDASSHGGSGGVGVSAQRKQQQKHFAIKAQMKKRRDS